MKQTWVARLLICSIIAQSLSIAVSTAAGAQAQSAETIRAQARGLRAGTEVQVQLTGREKVRGTVKDATEHAMTLDSGAGQKRVLPYTQIKSITRVSKHPHRALFITLGVVATAAIVVIVILQQRLAND
jgi:hypothetical protein